MDDDYEVFELSKKSDLLAVKCDCPKCRKHNAGTYIYGVAYVKVPCNKCGTTYTTDFKQDIYTKKARQINTKLAYANGLTIRGDEEYESDVTTMYQHYEKMGCWDLSDITQETQTLRRCKNCGVCFDCVKCDKCNKHFDIDHSKKKQTCPECRGSDTTRTRFEGIAKGSLACPHCESTKIKMSTTKSEDKCHICKSKELSEPTVKMKYVFTIERKKAYRQENL